ncbi:helix-turn-helix domain-containing protein [Salinibacterium sp. M195]|uniref:helix-turn-helix domain-containing protein n=1 Tax=Salinibacterium sp. M195 TaxID=2583374 RepID=UPI001C6396F1|nr:helix-turn-helix domain-containing protein [Salinibacterium sp. M195]
MKQLRSEAGLSQQQLAERAFVSRKWLMDFERGKPTVEANKVLDVFQALGYELELQPLSRSESRIRNEGVHAKPTA